VVYCNPLGKYEYRRLSGFENIVIKIRGCKPYVKPKVDEFLKTVS